MESVYFYSAVIAGVLLAGQVVLSLIGLGHDLDVDDIPDGDVDLDVGDHDFGHFDHGGGWFAGMLSFRAITAAVAVFGLVGLAARQRFAPLSAFLIALVAGGGVLYGVGWLLRMVYRLRSEGNVRIQRAVGQTATVYLTIPEQNFGAGKVTVTVQGRTMNYRAMTAGEQLPSATPVVIKRVISPGVVEVVKLAEAPEGSSVEGPGSSDGAFPGPSALDPGPL